MFIWAAAPLSSYLTYFFFQLVRSTPESDASETALKEQCEWKCAANLRALPEQFNRGIFRSDGEYFILSVIPLPLSLPVLSCPLLPYLI